VVEAARSSRVAPTKEKDVSAGILPTETSYLFSVKEIEKIN